MQIAFSVSEYEGGRVYNLSTYKAAMRVTVSDRVRYVQTCVDNASARTVRFATGKVFHGADALDMAIKAYKSSTCKEMLRVVQDHEAARKAA